MNLLFIHGRSQQGKDPAALQREWEATLDQGLVRAGLPQPANVKVVFPFYGDELDGLVRQIDAPLMEGIVAKGGTEDMEELQFRAEVFAELAAGNQISDAEVQAFYAGDPQEKGPLNWKWVHALLRSLDRTPLGDKAIDNFTRDVWVYLTYPVVRDKIDRMVADRLTPGKWVVVGHSLGTVVGYNVLRAAAGRGDVEIARYVTVGSPLGVRAIRRRLESPLIMPGCVRDWYNAYDARDAVALYPLDAHNFPIHPPIENNGTVDNITDNRHGIVGYLNDVGVARKIAQALG